MCSADFASEQLLTERRQSSALSGASTAAGWEVQLRTQHGEQMTSVSVRVSSSTYREASADVTAAALHAALRAIEAGESLPGVHCSRSLSLQPLKQ